jgi:hypothetical protein
MPKLVYIGGFGQSGSTLVEYLVTANPKAVACGEIVNGFLKRNDCESKCTCGKSRKDCPIWGVFDRSSVRSLTHEGVVLSLLEHIGSKYTMMTDASKTALGSATMPFRLRRRLGSDFYLLHIVRDPRAVCWSTIRWAKNRHNKRWSRRLLRQPFPRCVRTAFGWWIANLSCETFAWLYPSQYLRAHYEDFARSPHALLRTLFSVVLPDDETHFAEVGVYDNRHQLHGNRMRRKKLSFTDVQPDERWKLEMPRIYQRLAGALTFPLRAKYGY